MHLDFSANYYLFSSILNTVCKITEISYHLLVHSSTYISFVACYVIITKQDSHSDATYSPSLQLNFLITENRAREIVDPLCEGVQVDSLDALLTMAIQCVSSSPEDRPTMHRVVQLLESEVVTPCPSDFYDSD